MLRKNCTVLSQSELSYFFMYIIRLKTIKLAVTFPKNFEKVVNLCSVAMLCLKVFPNG